MIMTGEENENIMAQVLVKYLLIQWKLTLSFFGVGRGLLIGSRGSLNTETQSKKKTQNPGDRK